VRTFQHTAAGEDNADGEGELGGIILEFLSGEPEEDWRPGDWPHDMPPLGHAEDVPRARKLPRRDLTGVRKSLPQEESPRRGADSRPCWAGPAADKPWCTPEVQELHEHLRSFPWMRVVVIFCAVAALVHASSWAVDTAGEVVMAYEWDVPEDVLPTRSQYGDVPVVGRLFTMACDVGDLVRVNSAFLARYS
jgi:hypothetical protein